MVAQVSKGGFICVQGVDFGDGLGTAGLKVRVASGSSKGSVIKVSLDSRTGDAVAYVEVPSTGGKTTYTDIIVPVKNITGVHDVYFSFWEMISEWTVGSSFPNDTSCSHGCYVRYIRYV